MRRCHFCPSTELRSQRFNPVDVFLLPIGVRRYRCLFCGEQQRHSLIPRSIRWGLGILLALGLYVASPGPVDWLAARGSITQLTHDRFDELVYSPINSVLDRSKAEDCKVAAVYWKYRDWWVPANAQEAAKSPTAKSPTAEAPVTFSGTDVEDDRFEATSDAERGRHRLAIESVDRHFAAEDRR